MEIGDKLVAIFLFTPLVIILFYMAAKWTHHHKSLSALREATEARMLEPASLHPVFDMEQCIGCGACVPACPEGKVIGLISRRPHLVNPSSCIGHGACKQACPIDAIKLVFGSATRGVDIPFVNPDFQTNVPGIYIAGELGGMGLIKNALTQGRQAMESIRKARRQARAGQHDVIIVGAGPAGFAATLGAIEAGLDYLTIEQDSFGGTVAHFPRGKIVMTQPAVLPLVGKFQLGETSKEALMRQWQQIAHKYRVRINAGERMEKIEQDPQGGYIVTTARGRYSTQVVLLAIGRRGTPRQLGVPGEDKTKVCYRLVDPQQYRGLHVLVVGGGDSALEAAWSISKEPGTRVTLSYRSAAFSRAKPKNRKKIEQAAEAGRVRILFNSNVKRICDREVEISCENETLRIANDRVIISAGGILPTGMLKALGVQVDTKYGEE